MRSSETARWLTRSSTGWFTPPTGSNLKESRLERNRTLFLYHQLFTRLQNRPSSSDGQHGENGGQHRRILHLKEIADVCGIRKNLTFHIARHTFATTITLSNGVPIESVSKMLGHRNLKTTQHYAKVLDRKISEDMKNLREKLI